MTFTRRHLLAVSGALALPAILPGAAFAEASPEAVLQPGSLPDHGLGNPNAPVVVIEYASMTCPHCANFHVQTLPQLKANYLDEGKARYVLREYPLDDVALAAAMLARCVAGDDKRLGDAKAQVPPEAADRFYAFIDVLFKQQESWVSAKNIEESLFNVAKQAGFSRERFTECLTNEKLYRAVAQERERAERQFGVRSTPTLFVNGKKTPRGTFTIADLGKLIDAEVKS